jgi:predicted MFS family arabinose efflux permease
VTRIVERLLVEKLLPRRLGAGFRWLLASSWVSNLGDGFALAAGPLLVAAETRNPTLVALATLLQRLPWLLFAVFAGALADRWNRVAMVATVDLARAGVLAVLAVTILTHHVDIALVLVVMFVLGTAEVFSNIAASTLLPSIVERGDLTIANARLYAGFAVVYQMAGPPIGAALFAAGMSFPFLGQAVLVVVGALLVMQVKLPAREEPAVDSRRVRAEIAEGFGWTMRHPAVRTLVLTIFTFNITFGAAWSVLVLWARERLHMGPVGFGLLTTAGAVGGILGTAGYGWITRRVSLGNLMRVGLIIETFTHLAFALTTVPAVALAIMAVFGAHAFVWGTTSVTVRQRAVPESLQGRVSSVNSLGVYGGLVVGAAIGGPVASHWGVTAPFWFAFVGSAVFVVLIWRQLAHIAHDDDPLPVSASTG